MSEHTKTPWAIHDSGFIYSVPDSDHDEFHTVVCETDVSECPDGMFVSNDDARHIVKAVNNLPKVVEALEDAIESLDIAGEWHAADKARAILQEVDSHD